MDNTLNHTLPDVLLETPEGRPYSDYLPQTPDSGPSRQGKSPETAPATHSNSEKQASERFKLLSRENRMLRAGVKQASLITPFELPDGNVLRPKQAFTPAMPAGPPAAMPAQPVQQYQSASVPIADAQAQMQQMGETFVGNHGSGVAKGFKMAGSVVDTASAATETAETATETADGGEHKKRNSDGSGHPPLSNGSREQDDTAGIAGPPLSIDSLRASTQRYDPRNGAPGEVDFSALLKVAGLPVVQTPRQTRHVKRSRDASNNVRSVLNEDFVPNVATCSLPATPDLAELASWVPRWLKKSG